VPSSRSAAINPWRRHAPVTARNPDCARHQSRPRRHEPERRHAHGRGLQDTSRWFLRDATIKAANTIPGQSSSGLKLSRIWGDGSRSSSDGQRFAVERNSLLGSVDPAIRLLRPGTAALYAHSDRTALWHAGISCAPREAGYVLGGILDNDTALPFVNKRQIERFYEHLLGFARC